MLQKILTGINITGHWPVKSTGFELQYSVCDSNCESPLDLLSPLGIVANNFAIDDLKDHNSH